MNANAGETNSKGIRGGKAVIENIPVTDKALMYTNHQINIKAVFLINDLCLPGSLIAFSETFTAIRYNIMASSSVSKMKHACNIMAIFLGIIPVPSVFPLQYLLLLLYYVLKKKNGSAPSLLHAHYKGPLLHGLLRLHHLYRHSLR